MVNSELLIGRYVSLKSPDYLLGSAKESLSYGSNSMMIYNWSPRNSFIVDFELLKVEEFKKYLDIKKMKLKNVIVHGSYLSNLANIISKEKLSWSKQILINEINRMDKIGLEILVIHPGSSLGEDKNLCLLNIANSLNDIFDKSSNSKVKVALETMSGKNNQLGVTFEEIKFIIDNIKRKDRIGVCWDTCHLYSAGYDVKFCLESLIEEFDNKIGLNKLLTIHVNDSLHPLGSKKDRHENIGFGKIGLNAILEIVYHKSFSRVVKILETPTKSDFYKDEINLIKKQNLIY